MPDEPNPQPIPKSTQTKIADWKVPSGSPTKSPPAEKSKRRAIKAFTDMIPEQLAEFRKESEEFLAEVEAQVEAEEALPPEEQRQRSIDFQSNALQRHLLPRYAYGRTGDPAFLENFLVIIIQMAPRFPRGASCKSDICGEKIQLGDFRITLAPGMVSKNYHKSPGKMQSICLGDTKSLPRILPRPMLRDKWHCPEILPRLRIDNPQLLESQIRPRYWSW